MAMSAAAQWLQQALLDLCSDRKAALQLEPEVVSSLVSYCEIAPPADAQQYLYSIVGEEQSKHIVNEYLQRRGHGQPSDLFKFQDREIASQGEKGLHAYVKPKEDETWSVGRKAVKPRTGVPEAQGNLSPSAQAAKAGVPHRSKPTKTKGPKGGRGISLAQAAEGLALFPMGGPCNCQASRHKLINNCLGCGKIVCEQEGEGPCNFCGALVLKEGSDYAGLEGVSMPPENEAEAAAQAFKDRLVEFDRSAAQRTTVIDDQSDYFEIDGNAWISDKEKALLRKRQEEEERAEEARRKRVIVTIDLLGRKVVMEDKGDGKEDSPHENLILAGDTSGNEGTTGYRIKPNPFVSDTHIYVGPKGPTGTKNTNKLINHLQGMVLERTGRVQHDDPVIEAVIGQQWGDIHIEGETPSSAGWSDPKVRETGNSMDNDDPECLVGNPSTSTSGSRVENASLGSKVRTSSKKKTYVGDTADDSTTPKTFDICPRSTQRKDGRAAIVLAPSLLAQKQAERALASIWSDILLMPGMVLLKSWLTIKDQVEIVRECRLLGTGVGGFYQPTFADGRHMHLQMMCLGRKHWEATNSSYVLRRSQYDNATPPPIPPKFSAIVKRSLEKAQDLAMKAGDPKLGSKQVEGELPDMDPSVCIVNFYEQSGNLGMHQDKDESSESLKRGVPVVSFSIGDSAEFCYGNEKDLDKAEKVVLESGDVLIFGGPARMVFHGVTSIIPKSAPKELVDKTNLRPGRLNLTFREL